ncbi:MAG: malonyl-ACP O-methyltransferase BioC [Gammaproteobacteria bacterium]
MKILVETHKNGIRRAFAGAANSYDGVAALQRRVGEQLLIRHLPAALNGTVVDLGCGTGFLTARLAQCTAYRQLLALDLALPMLQLARLKLSARQSVYYLNADAECLPLRDASTDWLFSNLALQWSRNLPSLSGELQRVLKPGGRLAFSTFGPQTLQELKAAWAQVDDYAHVNSFYSRDELSAALLQAGFERLRISTQTCVNRYASPLTLLRELKDLGAQHVAVGRKRGITTHAQLQKMFAAYEELRSQEGVPATFEVLYVAAVKA